MRAVDIIAKKRDSKPLTHEEIHWFIEAYTREEIPDYQASALLMAIVLNGMTPEETTALTLAMAHSGQTMDLSDITSYIVDKHSSGGVGDKTSLVVLPLVAACGVTVAKMSGRGLGFSGGTLDKMEAIPGFNSNLSEEHFRNLAKRFGLVLAGQSKDLAPADGKLYALRDVTGTVQSLPLIVSSIMSKKIAAGAQGIVLDVKAGNGAFMTTVEAAQKLAAMMVDIGSRVGRDMIAVVSDMNQPLGNAVGNALEVKEALETLHGGGPSDFRQHCIAIAGHMLYLAGQGQRWTDTTKIKQELNERLNQGDALKKFREMVINQGGDPAYVDHPEKLPKATLVEDVIASTDGWVKEASAITIAEMAFGLGAGREKKGDQLDLAVGVVVHCAVGDKVKQGQPLLTIHANDEAKLAECRQRAQSAITLVNTPVEPLPLFYDTIYGERQSR